MKLAAFAALPLMTLACSGSGDRTAPEPTAPPPLIAQSSPRAQPLPPRAQPLQQHPAPARADNGKRIYGTYCASCHGVAGLGDGAAGKALTPPPADLTRHGPPQARQPRWQTILRGSPGTAMPAFANVLTQTQLDDLHRFPAQLRHGNRGAPVGHRGPPWRNGHRGGNCAMD